MKYKRFCFARKGETIKFELMFEQTHGGVLASTWVLKHKEHTGAHEDLLKNVQFVIGNDYALAA
jgi:hypothetical protein